MTRINGLYPGHGALLCAKCAKFCLFIFLPVVLMSASNVAIAAPSPVAELHRAALIEQFFASDRPEHQRVGELLLSGRGKWGEFSGTADVYYEESDDEGTRPVLRQALTTRDGEYLVLVASHNGVAFQHGDSVTVRGFQLEDREQELSYLAFDANGDGIEVTSTPSPTETLGDQRTLVMLVNFIDDSSEPFSRSEVQNQFFTQAAAYFEESSFNKMTISGDVVDWSTLPVSSSACDTSVISSEANSYAQSMGFDLSEYQRYVYIFPTNTNCGWSGLASLGGLPSEAFINGSLDLQLITHELGHTLGLDHAMGLECGSLSLADGCSWKSQADYLDSMGSRLGHYNSARKELLGWFDPGHVATVEESGIYELEPYAIAHSGQPRALKIYRGLDPATGYPEWLTVEYRQAIGFDSAILDYGIDSDNILNGTVIRLVQDGYVLRTWVLDMTPDSQVVGDFDDPALEAGWSFTDPRSGTTITTLSTGATAQVDVQLGDVMPACTTSPPTVDLRALGESAAPAGSTLQYLFDVTNNDSEDCSATTFDMSATVPSGWLKSLSAQALTLSPGTSGTIAVNVTSSTSADVGSYGISSTATHRITGLSNSGTASYSVINVSTNSAPIAVDDMTVTDERTAVTIPVLSNDSDPDGDSLAVIAVTQPNKGSVAIQGDGTLEYTPPRKFTGQVTFDYTVSDGDKQASAQVTVDVGSNSSSGSEQSGGGKGGGKGRK